MLRRPPKSTGTATPLPSPTLSHSNLARAGATAEAARLTARRTAELVKVSAVSRQDNDNAIAAQRQAEADVKAASAVVAGTRVQLDRARDRKSTRLNSSH